MYIEVDGRIEKFSCKNGSIGCLKSNLVMDANRRISKYRKLWQT